MIFGLDFRVPINYGLSMATKKQLAPTSAQFAAYEEMFRYFNKTLFGGELPPVLLNLSRYGKRTLGFFAPKRWQSEENSVTHEISLNPAWLKVRGPKISASTLVHEMAHLWQQEFGKPGRGNYHNREWADKMEEIGLMPSRTGEPGGKRTGDGMFHYIIEGGPFDRAYEAMPKRCLLPWSCADESKGKNVPPARNKVKYTCTSCRSNVWGKPELNIVCGDCSTPMENIG